MIDFDIAPEFIPANPPELLPSSVLTTNAFDTEPAVSLMPVMPPT